MEKEQTNMNNKFIELSESELMEQDGGLVICGVAINADTLAKVGVGVIVAGGVGMFAKGVYDGVKGN